MDLTAWPSPLFSLGSSLPCPLRSIDSRVTEERGEEQTRKREEVSDGGTGWVSDQVTRKDGCGTVSSSLICFLMVYFPFPSFHYLFLILPSISLS